MHSANCKLSIRVLVSAFFICVCSLHISANICMFLIFAVNSLRVRRCWQSANLIAKMCPKCINNYATIHQKPCKINPKSTKMVPRNAPKATLEASLFQVSKKAATGLRNGCNFCATWAILGAILVPAGRQGGPKNRAFGRQGVPKAAKIASKKRSKKKLAFLIEF